jgi:hypothetical protein
MLNSLIEMSIFKEKLLCCHSLTPFENLLVDVVDELRTLVDKSGVQLYQRSASL